MSNISTMPVLYKLNSSGKVQYWSVSVRQNEVNPSHWDVVVAYGLEGGKEQVTVDTIIEGKNLGKSNETSIQEQAYAEADAKWVFQIQRKGYIHDKALLGKDLRAGVDPMLAHRYDKYPHKIQFPCAIQPKLDGHRCIAMYSVNHDTGVPECKLYSRQREQITGLPHIEQNIIKMMGSFAHGAVQSVILDGELYNHEYKNKFEELTGFIRSKSSKDGYEAVQYHIYDVVKPDVEYKDRLEFLNLLKSHVKITNEINNLEFVSTSIVYDDDSVLKIFKSMLSEGYEGAMLRNLNSLYEGKRSYGLQKVKEFMDDEFIITGIEDGKGKMKGHAVFVCNTKDSKEFKASFKGSMEQRKHFYDNKDLYIGKYLTVMFQNYTSDGIPRFPVGLRIREDI